MLRKQQQIDLKEKNKELAAKAGFKAAELIQGSMGKYEEKQALIAAKEKQREAERIAKNKAKEEQFQKKLKEMEEKKEEFNKDLEIKKNQRLEEM